MENEKVNTSEKDVLDSLDESGTKRPVEEEEPDPTEKPLQED